MKVNRPKSIGRGETVAQETIERFVLDSMINIFLHRMNTSIPEKGVRTCKY